MQNIPESTVDLLEEDDSPHNPDVEEASLGKITLSVPYAGLDEKAPTVPPSDRCHIYDKKLPLLKIPVRGILSLCKPVTANTHVQATTKYAPDYVSPAPLSGLRLSKWKERLNSLSKYVGGSWYNLLLIFAPIGIIAPHIGVNASAVFAINCLAIVALADAISGATDDVGSYLGETVGALLNITLGNAAELAIL